MLFEDWLNLLLVLMYIFNLVIFMVWIKDCWMGLLVGMKMLFMGLLDMFFLMNLLLSIMGMFNFLSFVFGLMLLCSSSWGFLIVLDDTMILFFGFLEMNVSCRFLFLFLKMILIVFGVLFMIGIV